MFIFLTFILRLISSWFWEKSVPSRVKREGIQIFKTALNSEYFSSESNMGFIGFFITLRCFSNGNFWLMLIRNYS